MSRGDLLAVAGQGALFLGGAGQGAFLGPLLKPRVPSAIPVFVVIVPWLIVFAITFLNRPILSPRGFRYCLVFALVWFTSITVIAELVALLSLLPPHSHADARGMSRLLMHFGWLGVIPLLLLHNDAKRYEASQQESVESDCVTS